MLYSLYRVLTGSSATLLRSMTRKRLEKGKEDPARYRERFSETEFARPVGKLMWLHGASVGEALSVLPLLNTLKSRLPDWHFLLTTGTVTSATMMAQRLPEGVLHQFIPWDHPKWVKKFLNHWQPDAVIWLESELWPNMLHEIAQRNIPAGLINARMRPKTQAVWRYAPGLIREMLGAFTFILTGARDYVAVFKEFGGKNVSYIGSLKFGARPLPVAVDELAKLKDQIGNRPCLGFLQTHAPEEAIAGEIYRALKHDYPDLLLICVPRNHRRGDEVAQLLRDMGLQLAQRSKKELITAQTEIYLADTIGEMGLWYTLCSLAVIGGSFLPFGGQNPIEGVHFGAVILYGPHMFNFIELCAALEETGAAISVPDKQTLQQELRNLLAQPDRLKKMRDAAQTLADQNVTVIDAFADEIMIQLVNRS